MPEVTSTQIHKDLLAVQNLVYKPSKLVCLSILMEPESVDYGAYEFRLNSHMVKFRVAKTTPIKIGQFVTLWKRADNGPIQPYDVSDPIDFFVISTRKDNYFGQFIFPKLALYKQGILSTEGKGGKRALRVYPPWDQVESKQAKKTQEWQLNYFLEIPQDSLIDFTRVKTLYNQRIK